MAISCNGQLATKIVGQQISVLRKEYRKEDQYLSIEIQPYGVKANPSLTAQPAREFDFDKIVPCHFDVPVRVNPSTHTHTREVNSSRVHP